MISLVGEKNPLMMIAAITVRMSVQVVQKMFAREELGFQKNLLEILSLQQHPVRQVNHQQI